MKIPEQIMYYPLQQLIKCVVGLMTMCHAHFKTETGKVATAAQTLKCILE